MVRTRLRRTFAQVCAIAALVPSVCVAEEPAQLREITVTGTREGELKSETPAAISIVKGDTIKKVKPAHPSEIVGRVPGAALMQTNGEGHTTGIRHPIGTGAVYLYLEDGIPTRPTGFFNHNALFEIDVPNADGMEVTRGPGSALQGSDAIGAVFNVLTRAPSEQVEAEMTAEGGSYGWSRLLGTASGSHGDLGARASINITHTDGWRRRTEYDRQSASLRVDRILSGDAVVKGLVTATNADMQTGANARLVKSHYLSDPTMNYHSIAYRRVKAVRASVAYEQDDGDTLVSVTPYARWNHMELLASFTLGSDPGIANSGNASLGVQTKLRQDLEPWRTRLIAGADLDYSPGWRQEDRVVPYKYDGLNYAGYTRGGNIYDYDVTYTQASPYVHAETSPHDSMRLSAGLRADVMSFDYNSYLTSGAFTTTNSTGTGTTTLYRPADSMRHYSHLSPSLGATYDVMPGLNVFGRYKHSFRTPSESQLFRSGSDADTLHLKPVKVDNYELGLRGPDVGDVTWEVVGYQMLKRDDILSSRENGTTTSSTNNGKTRHYGIEVAGSWRFLPAWKLAGSTSYSRHRYATWQFTSSAGAVSDYSGNDIQTAPRTVSNATLAWEPQDEALKGLAFEGEWVRIGPYKMDDTNLHTYQGHHLFNLRGAYAVNDRIEVFGRMMNVFDARWATVAQYTSSREEFAPGMPRTLYGGMTVRF